MLKQSLGLCLLFQRITTLPVAKVASNPETETVFCVLTETSPCVKLALDQIQKC